MSVELKDIFKKEKKRKKKKMERETGREQFGWLFWAAGVYKKINPIIILHN